MKLQLPFVAPGETGLVPQARLSGPMPWVIAIMVALMVIALAAALSLRNAANAASAELRGGITVQILAANPEVKLRESAAVAARLRATPGVGAVRVVPQHEVDALIEPWLGALGSEEEAVPVPALIDARIEGRADPARIEDLRRQIRAIAPSSRVDAQATWLAPVFGAIRSLQWLALALVGLLALVSAAAVLLAARNALGTNRATVEIVHLLGGTDAQIAGVFQRSIGIDAAVGGVIGFLLGGGAVLLLARSFAALGAGLVNQGALGPADWVVLGLLPVAAALLATLTARLTVLRALRRML